MNSMKSLKNFVLESNKTYSNNVDATVKGYCDDMMKNLDYSKLKETNEQDPKRFSISKENKKLMIDNFDNAEYRAISSEEYYGVINKSSRFADLSTKEKADFDTQYGDIIIVDKNNTPKYFIDVKISDNYIGAVSLGSLANFEPNGVYICISKKQKKYFVVSHQSLVDAVKENPELLNAPTKSYKGYNVDWEGEKLTSEYFIKGYDIAKFK